MFSSKGKRKKEKRKKAPLFYFSLFTFHFRLSHSPAG